VLYRNFYFVCEFSREKRLEEVLVDFGEASQASAASNYVYIDRGYVIVAEVGRLGAGRCGVRVLIGKQVHQVDRFAQLFGFAQKDRLGLGSSVSFLCIEYL
jgi:hypothetical protein